MMFKVEKSLFCALHPTIIKRRLVTEVSLAL